jgi:hypothetical protein
MTSFPHSASKSDGLIAKLAQDSLTRLPALSDQLVDSLWDDVYQTDGPVPKDDLRRSCRDNIGNMLRVISDGGPEPGELCRSAQATGARRAEQHCPLEWVLHAWQLGGQLIWADVAQRAGRTEELTALVMGAPRVWGVIERFSAEMAATYHRAELDLALPEAPAIRQLVDALLDGRSRDVSVATAESLGFAPNGRYLVVVTEEPASEQAMARRLRSALARYGHRSVWQPRAGSQVAVVAADGAGTTTSVLNTLRATATGRVGVSPPLSGFGDIPAGYRMACLAQRSLPAGANEVATLDERLPSALLVGSPELTERVVEVTLGPLLRLPEAECVDLLDTLAAWLMSAGSAVRAAKLLYCHRNTVLNRLHRIEDLTSMNPMRSRDWLTIQLALTALLRSGGYQPRLLDADDLAAAFPL